MADERQLTINLALKSGTTKQQINSINKEIKSMESEFKNAGAGVEDFEKTSEGLSAKLKLQQSVLEKLKDKLNVYKKEQEKCTETLDKAVSAYEKQQARVKSLENQLESAKNTYGESSKEVKELEEQLTKANKALETKRNSVINANNSLTNMNTTINKTESEIKSMASEIQKTNNELDNIDSNNIDELGDSFDKAKEEAIAFGAQMTIIGEGVQKVGESVANTGKKIVGAMGDLVTSGSEYSAEIAGTEFILKSLDSTTQDLINSSSELASNIGLTNKQYKDSATNIANYYRNMGLTTEETNNLTESTMGLVADLGAITDIPFDESLSAFKSALQGNYEALDKFGVNVSATTLANTEYVKSLGKSWDSLSNNEKIMAIYNEVARQSASATGLASQEAQEFGMQNKLLYQRIEELKGSIGAQLLPILQPFLGKINEVVGVISSWVEKNPELVTTITGVVTVVGAVLLVVGTLVTTLGTAIIMWGAISTAIAAASIPFLAITGVITGTIAIIALLASGIASRFESIKLAIENLKSKFNENLGNIKENFNSTWLVLQEIYNTIIEPLFDTIGLLIEATVTFIADCMPGISQVFSLVFDTIKTVWDNVGKPIADFIIEVFRGVVDWFIANLPFLSQVFNQVMGTISTIWNNLGKPLFGFVKTYITYVIEFLKPVISALGMAFNGAFTAIKVAWNILYPIFDLLISIVSKVAGVAATAMSKFMSAITTAMKTVLTPIQWVIDKMSELFSWLGSVSSKIGGVIEKINPFKNLFKNVDLPSNIGTVGVGVDTSGISTFGLNDIALSGSYYTPTTRNSLGVADVIRKTNGNTSVETIGIMKDFISEIASLKNVIQELKTNNISDTNIAVNVNLDGKDIKAQTTKEVIKTINRSTNNYRKTKGGLALG